MSSSEATPHDNPQPEEWTFEVRDVLADRYEIVERLARGGFGEVHAAHDRVEDHRVALKILHPDSHKRDEKAVARMRQEAEILRALNHPNLVQVHDIVRDQGEEFLVMELLEGRSLRKLIDSGELVDENRARPAVSQMLSALDAMHARNVQHRDLKPDNIILRDAPNSPASDHIKLVDFGIAKARDFLDQDHEFTLVQTQENEFVGTPRYSAPEQAVGDPVDATADLFSLGLVVAEWFTGVPRIEPEAHQGALSVLIKPDPIDVSDCPEAWQPWLQKMIAKSREERYQSAAEAREELPGQDAETLKYSKGRLSQGFDPTDLPSTEIPSVSSNEKPQGSPDGAPLTADAADGTPDGASPPPSIGTPGDPDEPTDVTPPPHEPSAAREREASPQNPNPSGNRPPSGGAEPPELPSEHDGGDSGRPAEPVTADETPSGDGPPAAARESGPISERRSVGIDSNTKTRDSNPDEETLDGTRLRTAAAIAFFLISLAVFVYSLFQLF